MQQTQRPPSTQVSTKEQTIARVLGAPSFSAIDWRRLMQKGVLVRLSIHRCRWAAKLELADLGVSVEDERVRQALARTLVLGAKRLLPKASMTEIQRVESGARASLAKCSFRTEVGAFLPEQAYDVWKRSLEEYARAYDRVRDALIDNHRAIVDQVVAEYEIVARDTYERLRESRVPLRESRDAFVVGYCNRITSLIPTPQEIKDAFRMSTTLVDGVSQIQSLQRNETPDLTADALTSAAKEISALRGQAQDAQWQESAMERDLRQQAQAQKKALLDSFLISVVSQLRRLTYEVMTDVLTTLQKQNGSQRFPARSVVQLKNLVGQVRLLNFYEDSDMERIVAQVEGIVTLSPSARQRSVGEISDRLREIAAVTRATLLELHEEPRSGREVAVPDYPSETLLREARMDLGLDLPWEQFERTVATRAEREDGAVDANSLWALLAGEASPRDPRVALV
ncbi:MAG: hypothetical protein ABI324_24205 [Ktedonobacteraceae bacterium]